jgi:hypothetical protein
MFHHYFVVVEGGLISAVGKMWVSREAFAYEANGEEPTLYLLNPNLRTVCQYHHDS